MMCVIGNHAKAFALLMKALILGSVVFLFASSPTYSGVLLDNGKVSGQLNYWAVDINTGGESRYALITARRAASGDLFTENVLYDYFSYVDVGANGGALRLAGTQPQSGALANSLESSGSFIGERGNRVNWEVTSWIPDGSVTMYNIFWFESEDSGPLGALRFFQYMDEDVEGVSDDIFFTRGNVGGGNLELFTLDNRQQYGVSHAGALNEASGLENSGFAGWAANQFNQIKPRIEGPGLPVSPGGIIENLPTFFHPDLGRTVYGPRDIVSVLAWDVDPDESYAVVVTTLGGVPDTATSIGPPELEPPGDVDLSQSEGEELDRSKPTIVLTHGLQKKNEEVADLWTGFSETQAGGLIGDELGSGVNIVQVVWDDAFQVTLAPGIYEYRRARDSVFDSGIGLATLLLTELGTDYGQPIHFIGHSLGTAVNAYAARTFLNYAAGVTTAQFTALDRPDRLDALLGLSGGNYSETYGFDRSFFTMVLPIGRADLDLRIDNYYSNTGKSSGDFAYGPIYNHEPVLRNPNDLDDNIFKDEGFSNDHSGVHQWYRWTMRPNGFPGDGDDVDETFCDPDFTNPKNWSWTLDPCSKGWFWALYGPGPGSLPDSAEVYPTVSTSTLYDFESFFMSGCSALNSETLSCVEASTPYAVAEVEIESADRYLQFEYRFLNIGDGDYAALLVDESPIWMLNGDSSIEGVWADSGPIPIGALAGLRRLMIALYGVNAPNAVFEIRNLRTLSIVEPEIPNRAPVAETTGTVAAVCSGTVGTEVTLDGSNSSDPDGDDLSFLWSGSFGELTEPLVQVTFPVGAHEVTLTVEDGRGGTNSRTITVNVTDEAPPVIESFGVAPEILWPPNHKLVSVEVFATAMDNCDPNPVCEVIWVSSNEPQDGLGDGDTSPDWMISDDTGLRLRAERAGGGNGRVYEVGLECTDASGNNSAATAIVTVPHDR